MLGALKYDFKDRILLEKKSPDMKRKFPFYEKLYYDVRIKLIFYEKSHDMWGESKQFQFRTDICSVQIFH